MMEEKYGLQFCRVQSCTGKPYKGIHNLFSVFFFSVIFAAPWFVEIQKVCYHDVTASPLYWEMWFCNRAVWLTSLRWRQTTPTIFPRLRVLIRGDNERRALMVRSNIRNLITGKETPFPVVQDALSLEYWRLNTILIARASVVHKVDNTTLYHTASRGITLENHIKKIPYEGRTTLLEKRTDRCRFASSEKFKNVKSVSRIWGQNDGN